MGIREQGSRRVALVTTSIAVAGLAGATLVACTVTDTPSTTSDTSQGSTSDTQNQQSSSGSAVLPDDSGSAAHGHSGGS